MYPTLTKGLQTQSLLLKAMLEEGVSLARGHYGHKLNSQITPGRQLLGGEVLLKAKIALNFT